MTWTPGRRKAARALEAPYDDVPDHLYGPLREWIENEFSIGGGHTDYDLLRDMCVALRVSQKDQVNGLLSLCREDRHFMLDLVEALLEPRPDRWGTTGPSGADVTQLTALLEAANSAYRVMESWHGLEHRVAPGVKELVQEAINAVTTGSAGEHLTNAWNAAYGRKPDATKAYSEAIKAAEAALASRISPQNTKQTLGTMIGDITNKPSKWKFVIAGVSTGGRVIEGVDTMRAMMQLLWDGQTSRHGGTSPTRAETDDEARAAVHLAASLVQYGVSCAFDAV